MSAVLLTLYASSAIMYLVVVGAYALDAWAGRAER